MISNGKDAGNERESPMVAAVVSKIKGMIRDGSFPANNALPSERELSEKFAASRGVIRAAIRDLADSGIVEAKPRCRPVVVNAGRRLGGQSKRHIGIWLWPNISDYAASSILKGIQSADLGNGVRLIIASAADSDSASAFEAEARFLESMLDDPGEAGVIIWYLGGEKNLAALHKLKEAEIPTAFVDRLPPEEFPSDFVGTDNEAGARRAVRHLIDLGHKRIAFITNIEPVSTVKEREAGYRRALRDAGIPLDEALIQRDLTDAPEGAEAALDALWALPERPTAIFAVNDQIALQIYEVLQTRKISVPGQMSLVGFDGLLRWLPGGGYLTTCQQDFQRMGQLAAEIMIRRMENRVNGTYKHVLLDAPLLDRGSTATPKPELRNPIPSMENT